MTDRITFQVSLYSPKWATHNLYDFDINRRKMKIEKVGSKWHTECILLEGKERIWSSNATTPTSGHPLIHILEIDEIYPPSVFIRALEQAWRAWRSDELTDIQLQAELNQLFDWVDNISASLPRSAFWSRIF